MTEEEFDANLVMLSLLSESSWSERQKRQIELYRLAREYFPHRARPLVQEWWLAKKRRGDGYIDVHCPTLIEELWREDPALCWELLRQSHPYAQQFGATAWIEKLAPVVTFEETRLLADLMEKAGSYRWDKIAYGTLQHLFGALPRLDPAHRGRLVIASVRCLPEQFEYGKFDTEEPLARALAAAEWEGESDRRAIAEAAARHACLNEGEKARDWARRLRREVRQLVWKPSPWLTETLRQVRVIALLRDFAHRYACQKRRTTSRCAHGCWRRLNAAETWIDELPYPWLRERVARRRQRMIRQTPVALRAEVVRRSGMRFEAMVRWTEEGATLVLPPALLDAARLGADEGAALRLSILEGRLVIERKESSG